MDALYHPAAAELHRWAAVQFYAEIDEQVPDYLTFRQSMLSLTGDA